MAFIFDHKNYEEILYFNEIKKVLIRKNDKGIKIFTD